MSLQWFYKRPVISGVLGGALLLLFYFAILSIANSPVHAITQFLDMWYWIVALVVGFGIQVGLYAHIRGSLLNPPAGVMAEVAASGGISTVSMAACCAHHLADILPLIGLAAASAFLSKYQTLFLMTGVISNIIGITIMLGIIQKHGLEKTCSILRMSTRYNMDLLFKIVTITGIATVLIYWIVKYR